MISTDALQDRRGGHGHDRGAAQDAGDAAVSRRAVRAAFARCAPLGPLLAAEAAAEAPPGTGIEPADLEQAVWLRLLELGAPPPEPDQWLRAAVRAEARAAARGISGERPYEELAGGDPQDPYHREAADLLLAVEQRRAVRDAVRLLPGRCPQIVTALMSCSDPTYREISRELGISQGSLGPLRSRCLGCLRTILNSRVGSPVRRGNAP